MGPRTEKGYWIKMKARPVQVTYSCNPSYLGGRDQEDHGLRPAQANSSQDPILKNTQHKKGLLEWLKQSSTLSTIKKNMMAM
jgi:hypothetical protein